CRRSSLHHVHLRTLELHESGMCEVEGNGESGNAARRKPFFREPHVRTHPERPVRKLELQQLLTALDPCGGTREMQLSKAQREQSFVAPPAPRGRLPAGHPHIQRPNCGKRNSMRLC